MSSVLPCLEVASSATLSSMDPESQSQPLHTVPQCPTSFLFSTPNALVLPTAPLRSDESTLPHSVTTRPAHG